MTRTASLVLSDGTVWPGRPFGPVGRTTGEVVFCTAMTGYQEVLTDPSYCRQIVVMTASHIGNTGVNDEDSESSQSWVAGLVVNQASPAASSWRATGTLEGFLAGHGKPGIADIDTRALVRHLRAHSPLHGALVTDGGTSDEALELARTAPDINTLDLVNEVTCREPYAFHYRVDEAWAAAPRVSPGGRAGVRPIPMPSEGVGGVATRDRDRLVDRETPHVVVYDLGVKLNTLRMLAARGCRVTVVPARTPAATTLAMAPDGVLLSNGPGDPATLDDVVGIVRALMGRLPVFGICLGHQVLGLALGGRTYKLKFGHRGSNQPVRDNTTGAVAISSHNHGYAIAADSLPRSVVVSHTNLNDGCVEGLAAPGVLAFSVQYHPEAAPGPHDAAELFDRFLTAMAGHDTSNSSM